MGLYDDLMNCLEGKLMLKDLNLTMEKKKKIEEETKKTEKIRVRPGKKRTDLKKK
jgi:hypothetical protein